MTRRTCVTSMPSASAISATDAARCSSSRRCQWCASPSARINAVSCAADRASRSRVASESPDDITGKAIAQYQHPRRCVADFDHLFAEGERLRATVGQVNLPDWNLRG